MGSKELTGENKDFYSGKKKQVALSSSEWMIPGTICLGVPNDNTDAWYPEWVKVDGTKVEFNLWLEGGDNEYPSESAKPFGEISEDVRFGMGAADDASLNIVLKSLQMS